jgi:hypothetical protein
MRSAGASSLEASVRSAEGVLQSERAAAQATVDVDDAARSLLSSRGLWSGTRA